MAGKKTSKKKKKKSTTSAGLRKSKIAPASRASTRSLKAGQRLKKRESTAPKLTKTQKKPEGKAESARPPVKAKHEPASVKSKAPKSASAVSAMASARPATTVRTKRRRTVSEAPAPVADPKGYVFINGRRIRMISTKATTPSRKTQTNGEPVPAGDQVAIPSRKVKTKLSKKELEYYRNLLLTKRSELVGDLSAMEAEALTSSGGNISHMPIHMADIGTDTYDQDFMLGLAAAEREQLREIDEALQRIDDRTYGICQMTGEPIPKARLDAKPWAKYTIEAARKLEGEIGP